VVCVGFIRIAGGAQVHSPNIALNILVLISLRSVALVGLHFIVGAASGFGV
jgi:hypothetical protein